MSLSGSLAILVINSSNLDPSFIVFLILSNNFCNIFSSFANLILKASSMVSKCVLLSWRISATLFNKYSSNRAKIVTKFPPEAVNTINELYCEYPVNPIVGSSSSPPPFK